MLSREPPVKKWPQALLLPKFDLEREATLNGELKSLEPKPDTTYLTSMIKDL
jgi:hypothetical protein